MIKKAASAGTLVHTILENEMDYKYDGLCDICGKVNGKWVIKNLETKNIYDEYLLQMLAYE